VQAALGGWQMNATVTMAVGLPLYNFGESTSTCFCFGGLLRPDSERPAVHLRLSGADFDRGAGAERAQRGFSCVQELQAFGTADCGLPCRSFQLYQYSDLQQRLM
jgi:hypothetical protein